MKTKEEICKEILGKVNWKTMHELPIGGIIRATELFKDPDCRLEDVDIMYYILMRWGWFVRFNMLEKPPWEVGAEEFEKIAELIRDSQNSKGENQRALFEVQS